MPPIKAASATFTSDFRSEFEAETDRLLRRRFFWFAGLMLGLTALSWLVMIFGRLLGGYDELTALLTSFSLRGVLFLAVMILYPVLYSGAIMYAVFERPGRQGMLRLTMVVVAIDGLLNILWRAFDMPEGMGLFGFTISHVLAACFLPWSARQAMIPAAVVLGVSALSVLMIEGSTIFNGPLGNLTGDILGIAFSPAFALPGTMICWLRHSRRTESFKVKFLAQRYGEVRRELTDARKIHESLFPSEITDGPIHFTYRYEPMRQIGGDFLHVCPVPSERADGGCDGLNLVVIDVTGHGIPAALTVNRLHGELERIFAEDPLVPPGEVLRLLNRYVHLTLASHSIYGTAICLRVDCERGTVEYASGGHPPMFLRAVDGTMERLDSTSFVLGAAPTEMFDPAARTVRFGPGDSLIIYTDGAIEARGHGGKMLTIAGLERLIAGVVPARDNHWAERLLGDVEAFRAGPAEDDTLLVELFRPVTQAARPEAARQTDGAAKTDGTVKAQAVLDGAEASARAGRQTS